MANIWTAGSALMNTVGTVANTTSSLVTTVASSLDMVDSFVADARIKQIASSKIANANYLENLIQDSTLEQAKREQDIAKQLVDPDLSKRYSAIESRTRALFAPAN